METVFDWEVLIKTIVKVVMETQKRSQTMIPVGISNRHVHLSPTDIRKLFGPGYGLRIERELSQPGQYAAKERVTLVGPKGALTNVRVIGPPRKNTQVEISLADGCALGITPPILKSGLTGVTPCLTIVGPQGAITQSEGVMCAARHIHFDSRQARILGIKDGDTVRVRASGERSLVFDQVTARVDDNFVTELHLDVEEAHAADLKNGDFVELLEVL